MPVNDVKKRAGNFYAQAIQYGCTEEEFMTFFEEVMGIFVNAKKEYFYSKHQSLKEALEHGKERNRMGGSPTHRR